MCWFVVGDYSGSVQIVSFQMSFSATLEVLLLSEAVQSWKGETEDCLCVYGQPVLRSVMCFDTSDMA